MKRRARLLFLRGHAHNVLTEFDAKCEEFLSRAVKLDPTLVEAWNSLGECYWKQGNIEGAFNCFNGALGQVGLILIYQFSLCLCVHPYHYHCILLCTVLVLVSKQSLTEKPFNDLKANGKRYVT